MANDNDLNVIPLHGVNDTVNIPASFYLDLLEDSAFLAALEDAGVDQWEGYGIALAVYDDEITSLDDEEGDAA